MDELLFILLAALAAVGLPTGWAVVVLVVAGALLDRRAGHRARVRRETLWGPAAALTVALWVGLGVVTALVTAADPAGRWRPLAVGAVLHVGVSLVFFLYLTPPAARGRRSDVAGRDPAARAVAAAAAGAVWLGGVLAGGWALVVAVR